METAKLGKQGRITRWQLLDALLGPSDYHMLVTDMLYNALRDTSVDLVSIRGQATDLQDG